MNRTLMATIALAGVTGGALGWVLLDPGPVDPSPRPASSVAGGQIDPAGSSLTPTSVTQEHTRGEFRIDRQEFPLLPADVSSTREAPSLTLAPDGSMLLAWASQTGDDERTLMLARFEPGGESFGPAIAWRVVPTYAWTVEHGGRAMTHSTHVLPRLASGAGTVVLGWVEAEPGGPNATFLAARSDDGGRTFSTPFALTSAEAPRPGFTALDVTDEGLILSSWIDNRNGVQQPFVRSTSLSGEALGPDRLVFAGPDQRGICPCCDTVVLGTQKSGGMLVAFRNSDGGHRDIWISHATANGEFDPPQPVAPDRAWTFQGCPHDGPTMVRSGDRLVVAWMDGASGTDRVAIASADATLRAFSSSQELDPNCFGAQGHPRLVVGPDGMAHAVWEATLDADSETAEGGRAIRYARLNASGAPAGQPVFLDPKPGAYQTHPTLAVSADGRVVVSWNELDEEGKRVVVVQYRPDPNNSDVAAR
ncbi:exo-alpha-sialidase [Tautonia rosea]|uniref:exo-alpha-sialidase n=1 Tax=Tautonia rosea TaxID=2728037 RepID=UPI001473B430|nr:exo-alpha-sialidase [Tautonia rosea]